MKNFIKQLKIWLGIICQCGGEIKVWDERKYYCDKCGKIG